MANTDDANVMLNTLADGAAKVLQNARDLYDEATTLHQTGALGRALFLHQISLEECAKIEMLGAWAVSVVFGVDVNEEKVASAFSNHKAKNYMNAYMLPAGPEEVLARREKRPADSLKAFKQQQSVFHHESNTAKNASLYVDMQHRVFSAPNERITGEMVAGIARLNEQFLGGAQLKVRMLHGWRRNPSVVRALLQPFLARATKLMEQLEQGEDAVDAFMDELFARAQETGSAAEMRRGMRDSVPLAHPQPRFEAWKLRNYWGRLLRKVSFLRR